MGGATSKCKVKHSSDILGPSDLWSIQYATVRPFVFGIFIVVSLEKCLCVYVCIQHIINIYIECYFMFTIFVLYKVTNYIYNMLQIPEVSLQRN